MAKSLLELHQIGDTIDFTQERPGRVCNRMGDKVKQCPHCKRPGMYVNRMDGKVAYIHVGAVGELRFEPSDSCAMFPRTEFRLRYGYDGIHPRFHRPGDSVLEISVEEIRP